VFPLSPLNFDLPSKQSVALLDVRSCNACACTRQEEETRSELAVESECKATLTEERLRPATIERLESLFAQMSFDSNRGLTWDDAEAFFVRLFDELPLKQLARGSTTSPSESAAPRRDLSRQQSAALFTDVDVNQDQIITFDEFVGFWRKVKAFGYSDKDILRGLTSALERGTWKRWTASVPLPAWVAPLQLTAPDCRDPTPPSATLPDAPSIAVLRFQELAEFDQHDSDSDEPDENLAKDWCRLLDSDLADTFSAAATRGFLSPE
jgi:hypothetical protein